MSHMPCSLCKHNYTRITFTKETLAFSLLLTTDSQEDERELASVKKIRTNNSAEKKQVANVREETNKEEGHSCKTGHLSKLQYNTISLLPGRGYSEIIYNNLIIITKE